MLDQVTAQLVTAVLSPAVVSVILICLFGYGISARWAFWQKRRELTLTATNQFYQLYGEFFAVWKLWNYWLRIGPQDEKQRTTLLERASACEGEIEALIVKIASELSLDPKQVEIVSCFRQGVQTLRQSIRDRTELGWNRSDDPRYIAFKCLATSVSRIASSVDLGRAPTEAQAQTQILEITSNRWQTDWAKRYGAPSLFQPSTSKS